MKLISNKETVIATQTFGSPSHPAIVLVMGSTTSMLGWPDELCTSLAENDFYIIRFDHRDTGQSTTVPLGGATYSVEDMALDVFAILEAYGLAQAHLIGMSLGGYISQMVALERPERVLSLTLIGSEPLGWNGDPLPYISQAFLEHFNGIATLDWSNRAAIAAFLLQIEKLCAGTGQTFDEPHAIARIEKVLERTTSPASMFNHGSVRTFKDWTGRFRQITCPVLVIHGEEDPVLPVENGRAIAAGIVGSKLHVFRGMGHELPLQQIEAIAGRIISHIRLTAV